MHLQKRLQTVRFLENLPCPHPFVVSVLFCFPDAFLCLQKGPGWDALLDSFDVLKFLQFFVFLQSVHHKFCLVFVFDLFDSLHCIKFYSTARWYLFLYYGKCRKYFCIFQIQMNYPLQTLYQLLYGMFQSTRSCEDCASF